MEPIWLHDGRLMQVHDETMCAGPNCCIHNPSEHPLNTAPLYWASEMHTMYRECEHKVIHPDPDDIAFQLLVGQFMKVEAIYSVHIDTCDGCCQKAKS